MWKSKLTNGNETETDYAFKSRQEYCYYCSENPFERKTITGFLKYCDKRIKDCVFTGPKKPPFNTINNFWFKKWKWQESAKQYMKDNAADEKLVATYMYEVNLQEKIRVIHENLEDLYQDLTNEDNPYEKAKTIDSIDKLEKLLRLLLDKSVSNTQNKNHTEIRPEGLKRLEDAFK